MEKVGEDEEKTVGEASNSVEETRSNKEYERIRGTIAERFDLVDHTEEGSTDPSNSQTVTFEDHDDSECEMEDEKVPELFRRNSSVRPKVTERNKFPYLNKSEEKMVQQFQEDTPEILEGNKSSSASTEDTEDSSSNSDIDSSLSRYYFDGSLPVSAHVEEPETHQDESPVPKDENQVRKSQLSPKNKFSISNNSVVARYSFSHSLIKTLAITFSDASTVPQATRAATNFVEELLRTP